MPYLKTETITFSSKMSDFGIGKEKVKIFVNNSGKFYTILNKKYESSIQQNMNKEIKNEKINIFADSMEQLLSDLKKIFEFHYSPEVIKEPVIIYNIESHVSFAENENGEIFPNAGFNGTKWNHDVKYGKHSSSDRSKNGYSLTIGAQAKMKIIYKYGDNEKIEYENYYKGESHLGNSNPAQKLNSWCSFSLEKFKEIPYSDEAAEFFYNLMFGMAKISKMIQESTFEQEKLLNIIADKNTILLTKWFF